MLARSPKSRRRMWGDRRLAGITLVAGLLTPPALGITTAPIYGSLNALYEISADGHGELHAAKIVRTANRALAMMAPSPRARDMYAFANDALKDVAFDRFLTSSSGLALPDHSRLFTFTGKEQGGHYVVDVPKAKLDSLKFSNFFDAGVQINIKENPAKSADYDRGYGVKAQGVMVLDEFSHHTLFRLVGGELRVLDPANLPKLSAPQSELFPEVDASGRRVVDDLVAVYPQFAAFFARYEGLSTQMLRKTQDGKPYLAVNIRSKLKLDALANDYPDLGDFLQRLTGNLTLKTSSDYVLGGGLKLFTMKSSTADDTFELSFNTAGGGLLPEDKSHRVHFEALVVPDQVTKQDAELLSYVLVDVHGLRAEVEHIRTSLHYQDGAVATGSLKVESISQPKFAGALLGFLPPGLIDAFIPGSLDTYASTLIHGVLTANNNQGTVADVRIDSHTPEKVDAHFTAGTELVDNFFLRFGLKVANDYVWPDTDTLNDARNLLATSTAKLAMDLGAVKPNSTDAAAAH